MSSASAFTHQFAVLCALQIETYFDFRAHFKMCFDNPGFSFILFDE